MRVPDSTTSAGRYRRLTSRSPNRSAAALYSVVGTCQRLGLGPFAYLRDALARLPALPAGRVGDLLPDRWAAGRAGTAP